MSINFSIHACLVLLLALATTTLARAESLVEAIDVDKSRDAEIISLHFIVPVQYLYHTPEKDTDHTLIAVSIPSSDRFHEADEAQHLHRPDSAWLEDIEFFRRQGFNSHIYLKLAIRADVRVALSQDFRTLVITVRRPVSKE